MRGCNRYITHQWYRWCFDRRFVENWDIYMSEESAHADRDIAIMKQLLKKQKQVGRAFVAANKSMSLKFTMITVVSKRNLHFWVVFISGSM